MCVGFKVTQTAEWDGNSLGPEGRTPGVIHGHCAKLQNESTRHPNFPANPKKVVFLLKRYQVSNVDISFVNRDGVHVCTCVCIFVCV